MLSRCVHSCVIHVHGLKGILKVKTQTIESGIPAVLSNAVDIP